MGAFDITTREQGRYRSSPLLEVSLSLDDLDVLTKALWDLAALHSTYPRPHVERLHAVRRYLLAVQVTSHGDAAWIAALPAQASEST